jgi:hypothetical protein
MSAKGPGAVRLMTKELAMERIPQELSEEFSAEKHFIGQLTSTSYEFRRLATQYD